MPNYLWSVKDSKGIERAQKISAASAQEARLVLEQKGFTDLRLVRDDIMAEITDKSEAIQDLSAADQLKLINEGKMTFVRFLRNVLVDTLQIAIFCGPLVWIDWKFREGNLIWLGVGISAVMALVFFVIRLNSYLFTRMIRAREWHRADDVLRLLRTMDLVGAMTKGGLRSEDSARYRSLALVWKGNLEAGLDVWKRQESQLKPWTFVSHLGGLYEHAGDIDRGIEFADKAHQLNPAIGAYVIDLAWKHLLYERNLNRAKTLMDHAEQMEQTELARPFMIRNRAIIALRENRPEEAERLLLQAFKIWEANKGQHFRYSNLMLTRGYLCQARARLGKLAEARKDFAQSKPWLQAAKIAPVLRACEASV